MPWPTKKHIVQGKGGSPNYFLGWNPNKSVNPMQIFTTLGQPVLGGMSISLNI